MFRQTREISTGLRCRQLPRDLCRLLAICLLMGWHGGLVLAGSRDGKLKVSDAGSDPQRTLRFEPAPGSEQRLAYSLKTEELMVRRSGAAPTGKSCGLEGEWNLVTLAAQEESFTYGATLTVHRVEPADIVMSGSFSEKVVRDRRGLVQELEPLDEVTGSFFETPPWALHHLLDFTFPPRPVGEGATWQTTRVLELDEGLEVTVDTRFELKRLDDESALIVFSSNVDKQAVNPKYARKLDVGGPLNPGNRLFVSLGCSGKAAQHLKQVHPGHAEVLCQVVFDVKLKTELGSAWSGLASGEQITIKVAPAG